MESSENISGVRYRIISNHDYCTHHDTIYIYIYIYLNPSVWECQSAVLGYNYHTARESGTATVQYSSYHPVVEPLSLVRDIIITTNGIVYQWSKEPNKEILIQQHLNLLNLT